MHYSKLTYSLYLCSDQKVGFLPRFLGVFWGGLTWWLQLDLDSKSAFVVVVNINLKKYINNTCNIGSNDNDGSIF